MLLQQVTYHVFEHEISEPWVTEGASWHQTDGQIVLTFRDEKPIFLSWSSDLVQYNMAQRDHSFFNEGSLTEVDMTQHPCWLQLVGKEIELKFVDTEHQVLVVSNDEASVFVSSQYDDGSFCGDCVRVSQTNPL